jgi:hypothetical protein
MQRFKDGLWQALVTNRFSWGVLDKLIVQNADRLRFQRNWAIHGVREALDRLAADLTVRRGPFQGMRYPERTAVGSSFAPKLIGCYERELHPLFERIVNRPYRTIIDVGCAEGYYAVGLALRIPQATVHAYDPAPLARSQCRKMAELNGVADRVIVGETFTPGDLVKFDFRGPGLIICDCEGYEKELFSQAAVDRLGDQDVLIEAHDFFDPEITPQLKARFAPTHDVEAIPSVDDYHKSRAYDYPELQGYSIDLRRILLGEYRTANMEWLFMTPKRSFADDQPKFDRSGLGRTGRDQVGSDRHGGSPRLSD